MFRVVVAGYISRVNHGVALEMLSILRVILGLPLKGVGGLPRYTRHLLLMLVISGVCHV